MIAKTFLLTNEFRFACPIFKVETKIASCINLRDLVWRGEKPAVRAGCQCAMSAAKCPVTVVIDRMVREKTDPYHADTPRVGVLGADVIDKIGPVLVSDQMMQRYPLSPQEEKLLREANAAAREGKRLSTPARKTRMSEPPALSDIAPPETEAPTDASELLNAAASGDMSAAITSATGEAS